jgi:exosortase D (VPLPA-CTERM-specific)
MSDVSFGGPTSGPVLRFPVWFLGASAALALAVFAAFFPVLSSMFDFWMTRPEYSHGILIPCISAFLIWQQKDRLERERFTGSWLGVAFAALGVCIYAIGELGTLYIVSQYAFLIVLYGAVLSVTGWRVFRLLAIPLFVLFFMIPLPSFVYKDVSAQLQLISSAIGVGVIRLFGISVFLEGNVIDLGSYKLQVVEACDGLRYLFPLATLGFICAYFFKDAFWKRALVFVSSVPITILMNSFRIGTIGVMVEYGGISMAEGFLHDFQGWSVFMVSFALLLLEMWLLSRIGRDDRTWSEKFGITFPEPSPGDAPRAPRRLPVQALALAPVLVLPLAIAFVLPQRVEVVPDREPFARLDLQQGAWSGVEDPLDAIYLPVLNLDDYLMANFRSVDEQAVNLYITWYDSQRKDAATAAHSPRSCIPGGGWAITEHTVRSIGDPGGVGQPLRVNRIVIERGRDRQLVYYWFHQRGRNVTNEYMVKWHLFRDAVLLNRTDGAMIRVTTPVFPDQDIEEADETLLAFLAELRPDLTPHLPD